MSYELSQDQVQALNGITDTLLNAAPDSSAVAVLTGAAGTGKSTIIQEIINLARNKPIPMHVNLCATTHRAAAVLADITGHTVHTGHTLFKLRPGINKYGKETLKINSNSKLLDPIKGSLIILDEASMVGDNFLKSIVEVVKKRSLKILFVGDSYQLPPTLNNCSLFDGSLKTFTLTTIHRQHEKNPILTKALEYRDFIAGYSKTEPTINTSINDQNEGIHLLSKKEFTSAFVKKYINYEVGAKVDIPMCSFTNAAAINYNNMVRKATYFLEDTVAPFYAGERLISNNRVVSQNNDRIYLNNNEEVTVVNWHKDSLIKENSYNNPSYNIPGYLVEVKRVYERDIPGSPGTRSVVEHANWVGSTFPFFVPVNATAAANGIAELKKRVLSPDHSDTWEDFYNLTNVLADLRSPFAGTVHKAQGGTYPAVFIDKLDIDKCRNVKLRARLMYVALTRARHNVYINS